MISKCDGTSSMGTERETSILLRDGCQTLAPAVMAFFQVIQKCWPEKRKTSYISHLFRKWIKSDLQNYCPISLHPIVFSVFAKSLFHFLDPKVRNSVKNAQPDDMSEEP